MKIIFTYLLILCITFCNAQELLRNPSFESNCICGVQYPNGSTRNACVQWDDSPNWTTNPFYIYKDSYYFNTCAIYNDTCDGRNTTVPLSSYGYEIPHTGNAYVGIYTQATSFGANNFHTFLNQHLTDTLVKEAKYDISFYTSFSEFYNFFNNSMQVIFTDTLPYMPWNLNPGNLLDLEIFHPQVDFQALGYQLNVWDGWQQLKASFIANGSETYMTIGNYKNDNNCDTVLFGQGKPFNYCSRRWDGSYYFIDDVSLNLGIDAGKDTVICTTTNNSLHLKASAGWQHYTWSTATGATVGNTRAININAPGTYIVTGTVDSLPNYSKIDTVVVTAYNIVPALFAAHTPNDTTVCAQTPVTLKIVNPNNQLTYNWQINNSTASSIIANDSGVYYVKIYSGTCYKTDSVTVSYYSNQQSLIDSNTIHINNLHHTITANSGFTNYEWRDENNELIATTQSTSYTPVIASPASGVAIYISAINHDGCLIKDTLQVIYKELPIIISNPQIIGKGDRFKILNLPPNSSVMLYDTMGKLILNESYYLNNFSLDNISEGIYFYELNIPNQNTLKGKVLLFKE